MGRRNRTLIRALRLARLLQGRRVLPALDVLAGVYGVSTRTIRRDIAALEEAHYDIPPSLRELRALVEELDG